MSAMNRLAEVRSPLMRSAAFGITSMLAPLPSVVLAQQAYEVSAAFSLSVREVDRATGLPSSATPGEIDPSEAVRLSLSVGFTPGVGATTPFSPPTPPPGVGTVAGWASTNLALAGSGGTNGTFSQFVAASGFRLTTPLPSATGLVLFGAYSQEAIVGLPPLNSSNPVNEFISFVWTPTDYAPRSVMFHTATPGELPYRIALLVQPQGGSPFVLPAYVTEGRVTHADTGPIVIVPAPAALSLLLAGLALRRSGRGRASTPRGLA